MPRFALEPEGSFLGIRPCGSCPPEVMQLLTKAHATSRALGSFPEDGRYFLPPREVAGVLRALALVGQFSFAQKPLIMNLFSAITVENKKLIIRGESVPLAACDAIGRGNPLWCIYRGCFRLLAEEVEWEDLQATTSPAVIECWPILQLVDRHGAFANLVLDYAGERMGFHEKKRGRDLEGEERWERDLLETDFQRKHVGVSHYYCPLDKVAKALTFLLEVGWMVLDCSGKRVYREGAFEANVQSTERVLQISGVVRYDQHQVNLAAVVGAFNRREQFVQLDEQSVGLLERSERWEAFREVTIDGDCLSMPKYQLGKLDAFCHTRGVSVDSRLRPTHTEMLSDRFQGVLRPYQQQGLDWMNFLYNQGFNGLLADDMGLGKTVQVIAFLSQMPSDALHLIVGPNSLLFNWRQELLRFLPDQVVTLYHGAGRQELALRGVVLTSYGTLRQDIEHLRQFPFHCVVLDEAQAIKNSDSEVARSASELQSLFRLSVSGTPIENRAEELWSQLHFLMPHLLGERQHFRARVAAAASDHRHAEQIRSQIRPFILRRTKGEVAAELPPKIEQVVEIEMHESQRALYEKLLKEGRRVAMDGSRMEVLELILRLRQVCCHPLLFGGHELPSAKFEILLEDLKTLAEEGKKVLVYSQFASMLHLIGRELDLPYVLLEGSTRDREKVVSQFQEDPNIPIFLISLKAGGTGLNLTAADTVLIYDPWWNAAVEEQAIDRAHRIGQVKAVIAKRYILLDSIEQNMMKLKAHKQTLGEAFVEESLSTETLRALLTSG